METTIKCIRESMVSGCKILDIYGENYAGHTNHRRPASRAVMVDDGKILLSYEELLKRWMVPGGGLEGTETPADCCVREAAEETGRVVETGACFMQINEYFEDWAFISYFFECTIKDFTQFVRQMAPEPAPIPLGHFVINFTFEGKRKVSRNNIVSNA